MEAATEDCWWLRVLTSDLICLAVLLRKLGQFKRFPHFFTDLHIIPQGKLRFLMLRVS